MSRNPYARSLRVKPQQVIPDKREALREKINRDFSESLHALYDLDEPIPDEWKALLSRLK